MRVHSSNFLLCLVAVLAGLTAITKAEQSSRSLKSPSNSILADTIWSEGFESGWDGWSAMPDSAVWQIGAPTSGPNGAHSGSNVAATVLGGDYPYGADTRLISPSFVVPSVNPRLRFCQWFSTYNYYDYGRVEVSISGRAWQIMSAPVANNSLVWSEESINLSNYADSTVRIAFHFVSNMDGLVAAGWYIDDVTLESGALSPNLAADVEDFESGWRDWYADRGNWEVGVPTNGPSGAHSGTKCAGTVLGGDYPANASTRLISPSFTIPSDHPRLLFWHWFSTFTGDSGLVEISVNGRGWNNLGPAYYNNSNVWSQAMLDLSAYADSSVRVAFHFISNSDANAAAGWFIDDLWVATGSFAPNLAVDVEDFDSGWRDWYADKGNWEIGIPILGPSGPHSGTSCAGTVLGNNYPDFANTRLISPSFVVPSDRPRLSFWQWFNIRLNDYGVVQVSVNGRAWVDAGPHYDASGGGVWAPAAIDLSAYADSSVRVSFYFNSNGDGNVSAGWYIDDVAMLTGASSPDLAVAGEDFEYGWRDWYTDRGNWEIGVPTYGPNGPHSGTSCAGTILGGDYPANANTRLISPSFTIPSDHSRLLFWHWFSTYAGDSGYVEISVNGRGWNNLGRAYYYDSNAWTHAILDLSAYADSSVRVAFHFISNGDAFHSAGWYVDDISLSDTSSYSFIRLDSALYSCPDGDQPYHVLLRDVFGNPVSGNNQVRLDFSQCALDYNCPSQIDWPMVSPVAPSNANGELYFNPHIGKINSGVVVLRMLTDSVFAIQNFKSFDNNGDSIVNISDWTGGIENDYNLDGIVTSADYDIFRQHMGHSCNTSSELSFARYLTANPPSGHLHEGQMALISLAATNTSPVACTLSRVDYFYLGFNIGYNTWTSFGGTGGSWSMAIGQTDTFHTYFVVPPGEHGCLKSVMHIQSYPDTFITYINLDSQGLNGGAPDYAPCEAEIGGDFGFPIRITVLTDLPPGWTYTISDSIFFAPDTLALTVIPDSAARQGQRGSVTAIGIDASGIEIGSLTCEYIAISTGCQYTVGDANNSGMYNGVDIVYGVSYFKGGSPPPYSCDCPNQGNWYVAGDVNGSCTFNGLDITYGVTYFKGGPPPNPCPDCPPTGRYRRRR